MIPETSTFQQYYWLVTADPPIALNDLQNRARAAGFTIAHTKAEEGYDMRSLMYGGLAAKTEAAALWLQMNAL